MLRHLLSRTLLVVTAGAPLLAQSAAVPFDVCAQSVTWTRPTADVQAKMWNDGRYRDIRPEAYAWTHTFLWSEPDSASISYHQQNVSGLWTEPPQPGGCPRRDGEQDAWAEVWTLNHLVTGLKTDGLVTTLHVVPQARGYEIIQFRRQMSSTGQKARIRFVDDSGKTLAEWLEVSPGMYTDAR